MTIGEDGEHVIGNVSVSFIVLFDRRLKFIEFPGKSSIGLGADDVPAWLYIAKSNGFAAAIPVSAIITASAAVIIKILFFILFITP